MDQRCYGRLPIGIRDPTPKKFAYSVTPNPKPVTCYICALMILLVLISATQQCFDLGKVTSGGRHTGDLGFVGKVVVSDSSRSVHSQRLGSKRWGDRQRPRRGSRSCK